MTTYRGNAGVLKVGASPTAVAELTGFTLTAQVGTIEDTAQGDTARTYVPDALPTFSGSMSGHYFPADTNGQAAIVEGATLAFEMSPIGTTTSLQKLSGSLIVTQVEITSNNGAIVGFTAQFQGTGALTRGANS